jgi:hypothetical protein
MGFHLPAALATAAVLLIASAGPTAPPGDLPAAIWTDPAPDAAHPARMAVLHIPSVGVEITGVAYLAAGPGPDPTEMLRQGLPGDEKTWT